MATAAILGHMEEGASDEELMGRYAAGEAAAFDELYGRHERRIGRYLSRTLRDEALAVEALRIFNERNIDDLIVVNAKREPVGLVDSQDLPKLKLM